MSAKKNQTAYIMRKDFRTKSKAVSNDYLFNVDF